MQRSLAARNAPPILRQLDRDLAVLLSGQYSSAGWLHEQHRPVWDGIPQLLGMLQVVFADAAEAN